MLKKEVLYPFFLEVCVFTQELFWKELFDNLAYGIPPNGSYIIKKNVNDTLETVEFLCCSIKTKEFSYKLERKPVEVLYHEIKNLCLNKLLLVSNEDKIKKEQSFLNFSKTDDVWININKKITKDSFYEQYVMYIKEKFNLSVKETKEFFKELKLALLFKTINSKDIIFQDGKITNINGIVFQKEGKQKFVFTKDIYKTNIQQIDVKKPKKHLIDYWNKHLEKKQKML